MDRIFRLVLSGGFIICSAIIIFQQWHNLIYLTADWNDVSRMFMGAVFGIIGLHLLSQDQDDINAKIENQIDAKGQLNEKESK